MKEIINSDSHNNNENFIDNNSDVKAKARFERKMSKMNLRKLRKELKEKAGSRYEKKLIKQKLEQQKKELRLKRYEDLHWYRSLMDSVVWFNRFAVVFLYILSLFLEFVIEAVSRHSFFKGIAFVGTNPFGFLYNAFIVFLPFMITFFLTRRAFARTVISVLWIVCGAINGIVLSNRVTPFNAQDFKVLGDATALINNYMKPKELVIIVSVAAVVIFTLIKLWKILPAYKGKKNYVLAGVGVLLSIALLFGATNLALSTRVISNYFGNIAFAYEDFGFPYCFFSSVFNTGIDKPSNYNQKTMDSIASESKINRSINDSNNPNIIFVQLESFMDPSEVSFLKMSEDPIPNFRRLMNNYSTGYFKVPSIGAGTSNTEFECLTGMSMRYFGPGEYPYKTKLKTQTCESAASVLGNLGYTTHAIHNNGGNFYSRADVFSNMGFDTFTSKEEMNILETTYNGWATDDILLGYIKDCLDSSEGSDFIYTITVQSHGKYPSSRVLTNPEIKVTAEDKSEAKQNQWEYYINEIHEVDQFVGDLINMVDNSDEDTVVVLYGDHLPTMGLKTSDVACRYLYNTEYVIYDNFGLEKKNENLCSYQIMSEVMNRIGINSGTMFNYHQNRRKTSDYQEDLELLEYDLLYGDGYVYDGTNAPVITPHIQYGLFKPEVTKVNYLYDGYLIIRGKRFNQNSRVFINGEKVDTNFWNDEKIVFVDKSMKLKEGDEIVISQMGSKSRIFTSSDAYIYHESDADNDNDAGN